jgi:hypothetical protein
MPEIIIGFVGTNEDLSDFASRVLGQAVRTDAGSEVGGNATLRFKTNSPLSSGADKELVELVLQPGAGFSAREFVNSLCEKQEASRGTILVKVQKGYYECDDRPAIINAIEKAIKKIGERKGPATVSQAPSESRSAAAKNHKG